MKRHDTKYVDPNRDLVEAQPLRPIIVMTSGARDKARHLPLTPFFNASHGPQSPLLPTNC